MRLVLIAFFLSLTVLSSQAATMRLHGSAGAPPPPACPYGAGGTDGCGVSPGAFVDGPWPLLAKQSGQTWNADHPQTWNLAGIDYGVGPNATIASLTDVANFPAGSNQCTYHADAASTMGGAFPHVPALICVGTTQSDFTISGYNFGPTAYQGAPASPSHDCVNLIFKPTGTLYTPTATVQGNAWINGSTCAPIVSGVNYGFISANNGIRVKLKIWNNYFDGRNDESCCPVDITTQGGIAIVTNSHKATVDIQYNYAVRLPSVFGLLGWAAGQESDFPCSNGTSYNLAGYSATISNNYIRNFGHNFGAGHWEIATMGSTGVICQSINDYNTVVWENTMAAEGTTTFFGFSTNDGLAEYVEVDHNTVVTNLVGGKQYPNIYEYANFHSTNLTTPTLLVYDTIGSSCGGTANPWTCTGWVAGTNTLGGTQSPAPTVAYVVGTQDNTSGNSWNGGCNSGSGATSLCPRAGNYPHIADNFGQVTWTNTLSTFRVVSKGLAEYDHGNSANSAPTASANGSTGSPTISVAACPADIISGGTDLWDATKGGVYLGAVKTCTSNTITLFANALVAVANGDTLTARGYGYGQLAFTNNYVDGGGSNSAATNGAFTVAASGGPFTGTTITTNVSCTSSDFALASIYDVTQSQTFVGTGTGCTGTTLTLTAAAAIAVNNGDLLRVHNSEFWYSASPAITGGGYNSGGSGGCRSPTTITGNFDLRTGIAMNKSTLLTGGC